MDEKDEPRALRPGVLLGGLLLLAAVALRLGLDAGWRAEQADEAALREARAAGRREGLGDAELLLRGTLARARRTLELSAEAGLRGCRANPALGDVFAEAAVCSAAKVLADEERALEGHLRGPLRSDSARALALEAAAAEFERRHDERSVELDAAWAEVRVLCEAAKDEASLAPLVSELRSRLAPRDGVWHEPSRLASQGWRAVGALQAAMRAEDQAGVEAAATALDLVVVRLLSHDSPAVRHYVGPLAVRAAYLTRVRTLDEVAKVEDIWAEHRSRSDGDLRLERAFLCAELQDTWRVLREAARRLAPGSQNGGELADLDACFDVGHSHLRRRVDSQRAREWLVHDALPTLRATLAAPDLGSALAGWVRAWQARVSPITIGAPIFPAGTIPAAGSDREVRNWEVRNLFQDGRHALRLLRRGPALGEAAIHTAVLAALMTVAQLRAIERADLADRLCAETLVERARAAHLLALGR